ncbi:VOC family protein [Streptomyces sp. NPDC093252]|uniref:VOC family protein n=1 Tax=Streptomyces sp. NPDC093252 TaxID=3154980 RepID=UPI003425C406
MPSPEKLAHVVLWTHRVPLMRDWYVAALDARVVHENPFAAFITYDDEHHRIAVLDPTGAEEAMADRAGTATADPSPSAPRPPLTAEELATLAPHGLAHIAFTYRDLAELLANYERLRRLSITPHTTINHGPTTSMYYADPEGNQIELQVDNFATVEEGTRFMESDAFRANPIGVPFDPDELLARLAAGEAAEDLVRPSW